MRVVRIAALYLISSASIALAEPGLPPAAGGAAPAELEHDLRIDGAIAAAAAATWLGFELLQPELAPGSCRWCQPNALDSSARDALRWRSGDAAHQLSSLTAYGLVPLTTLGLSVLGTSTVDGQLQRSLVDVLVVTEAVALAAVVGQGVKLIAARRRPFVAAGTASTDPDRNLSFYSGHTAFAFAVGAAATVVAVERGYRTAPWVALAGAVLATSVGYLRIAADRHYLTDVLAGAAVGAGVGAGVPLLLHPARGRSPSRRVWLLPTPGGAALLGSFW